MTLEQLKQLEEESEAIKNEVQELKAQYPDFDASRLEAGIDRIDSLLSGWALELDTPDMPII